MPATHGGTTGDLSRAACAPADPHLFTATTPTQARQALTYCRRCPVTRECLKLRGRLDGVWGGRVYGGTKDITGAVATICSTCHRPIPPSGRNNCPGECIEVRRAHDRARRRAAA